jgi:hypothetical protein
MPNDTESDPAVVSRKLLLEQLSSEYKILQDKIDKIGAFKFTIRGWSVTIVVASCIGATTAHLPSPLLPLGLVVFVWLFFRMEQIQTQYREIFSQRCRDIERWIWRLLREQGAHAPGMVPKIAHEIADQTRIHRRWKDSPRLLRSIVKVWKSDDDILFNAVLVVAIVILTIWLARHPNTPVRADQVQNIQYNVPNPDAGRPAPLSPKTDSRKEAHGASKKTTSRRP